MALEFIVVDDDDLVRKTLSMLIESQGYNYNSFKDSIGCIEYLKNVKDEPQGYFIDMKLIGDLEG